MTPAAQPQAVRPEGTVAGILCMVGFALTAPVMDSFAKATPAEVPVAQILAARFGVQVVVLVPLALALGMGRWPAPRDWGRHLIRSLLLLIATGCFFSALRFMPIANALAIFFVAPFVITILGGLLLGEDVGWRRLAACAVGFLGALLVIQPSFADLGAVALLPLGTAVCFALYMILTRRMAQDAHPVALQAWTALAACAVMLPLLWGFEGSGLAALDPVRPTGRALWMLAGVGVMATISHLFISFALRLAPAATIAPLQYLEIVTAVALGYWVFGDFPDALTWAGIVVIVASGLYVFAREQRLSLRRRPLPPA